MPEKCGDIPNSTDGKRYNFSEFSVLVVSDAKFMREFLGRILRGFGVKRVTGAKDADEALVEIALHAYDFLLLDWMIPPVNGGLVIRKLRRGEDEGRAMTPVIMITTHSQRFRVEAARDAGANEFLTLPLAPVTLFDRIVSLIDNPRPFIKTKTFFGPERRRTKREEEFVGPWRRRSDPAAGDGAAEVGASAERVEVEAVA